MVNMDGRTHLILLFCFTAAHTFTRLLTIEKTPGCSNCTYPLYYVKASGPNDTIHYIWDFTSKPTVFVSLTKPKTDIKFNWTDFSTDNKSINFDSPPVYTFTLVLNKLIEFDDVENTGILTISTRNVSYGTEYFTWKPVHIQGESEDGDYVSLSMKGSNYIDGMTMLKGSVFMELTAFATEGHGLLQPRLIHSENSTQCKIILDKLLSNSEYNSSRYAVEFIMVSSDSKNSSSKVQTRMKLDDEDSPGVFSVVDLMTPQSQDELYKGVFLQWRPVAFTNEIPSLVNSTEVMTYNVTDINPSDDDLKDTLIYKYYGSEFRDNLIQQTVVSFGFSEDGFYKKTNFSSWTFTINYGSPENQKFSLLIIMVMVIGLGIPAILALLGGSYMIARRLRNRNEVTLTR